MEEHRLKPMGDYNQETFNLLYKKVEGLKVKLASQIDHRIFGLTHQDMISWFDIKIIYIFNKYGSIHNPDVLLGHIIRGLQFFKCRILRAAYTQKYNTATVEMNDYEDYEDMLIDENEHTSNRDTFYEMAMAFMETHLSENAYELFCIQLNPPPYIMRKMDKHQLNYSKIPNRILVEYFSLEPNNETLKYIDKLKKEIASTLLLAKAHFSRD